MEPVIHDESGEFVPPLKKWQIYEYDFIGVVLSDQIKLGLIKTPDGEKYRVTSGMELGNKKDKIKDILIDRLILENGQGEKLLVLKNHEF